MRALLSRAFTVIGIVCVCVCVCVLFLAAVSCHAMPCDAMPSLLATGFNARTVRYGTYSTVSYVVGTTVAS